MQKENILSFYSKTIQDRNLIGNPNKSSLNNTNSTDTSNDSSGIEPLYIDDESDKNEGKICQPEVPLLTTIKDANLFDKGMYHNNDDVIFVKFPKSQVKRTKMYILACCVFFRMI